MIFLTWVATQFGMFQPDVRQGQLLGEKLKKAGTHEIEGLVDRAMFHSDFKTMKKEDPEQLARIKAYVMRVIAHGILKKSDDMLKNDALKSSAAGPDNQLNESDFTDISFDTVVQPIQQGMSLLDLDAVDPALFVTSFN